jgi:hypothetical protein
MGRADKSRNEEHEMSDRFLNELRQDPDPRFTTGLRARLRAQEPPRAAWWPAHLTPTLAGALAVGLVVALFTIPSVRVSAQAMLDVFRVRKFAAVPFDAARMDKLQEMDSNRMFMVFDKNEVVREPGVPQVVASTAEAATAAGFPVVRPSYLPEGLAADTIKVQGAGELRLSVNEAKLRALLDALDLKDVRVPSGLEGKVVDVRKAPIVVQQFRSSGARAALMQSNSPEIAIPPGVDIVELAQVGLRVLGLDAGEARQIATSTDWRSTLLVPVPLNASTFRQVTVRGNQGLLITMSGKNTSGDRVRQGTVVMWSEGDRVFAATGTLSDRDMLQMVESMQ